MGYKIVIKSHHGTQVNLRITGYQAALSRDKTRTVNTRVIRKRARWNALLQLRREDVQRQRDYRELMSSIRSLLQKEEQKLLSGEKHLFYQIQNQKRLFQFKYCNRQKYVMQETVLQRVLRDSRSPLVEGRYRLLGLLGKGGCSEVMKALDSQGRLCVLKVMHLDRLWTRERQAVFRSWVENEVQVMNTLKPDGRMVQMQEVFQLSRHPDTTCLVLEYLPGVDLHERIVTDYQNLTASSLASLIASLVQQVHILHEQRYIHYDLKPSNFLVTNDRVHLIDFGLTKRLEQGQSEVLLVYRREGTVQYQPPECHRPERHEDVQMITISQSVDTWAVGCIIYQLIYGVHPFFKEDIQVNNVLSTLEQPVQFDMTVPLITLEYKELIQSCLSLQPDHRPSLSSLL